MRLIGLTGDAGAGKDTAAFGLIRQGYRKIAFADAIKEAVNMMTGWNMSQWSDREWKETPDERLGVSPRHMAQTLGTEWGRNMIHPDIWVNASMVKVEGRDAVFTDVRFDNEARIIRDAGGFIIKIFRPDNPFAIGKDHASEAGVDPRYIDYEIINGSGTSIDDLILKVDTAVNDLYGTSHSQLKELDDD